MRHGVSVETIIGRLLLSNIFRSFFSRLSSEVDNEEGANQRIRANLYWINLFRNREKLVVF